MIDTVEKLSRQCAHRFTTIPADPFSSVSAELFPVPQSEPSQSNVRRRLSRCTSTRTLLVFCQKKSVTRFPLDVWQAFFYRSFGAPIPKILVHAHNRTLCPTRFASILWVIMSSLAYHTGSIRGHNHLMEVVASLSRDSKIGPVRVNHKVSTTGNDTRK